MSYALRRREVAIFMAGLLLFAAGAANLIVTQQKATTAVDGSSRPETPRSSRTNVVGRPVDEGVASYIARKKSLLASRAKKDSAALSFAVVSFDSYRTAELLGGFLSETKLTPRAAILRIPIEGFPAEEVRVGEEGIEGALRGAAKRRAEVEITRAEDLSRIIPSVRDPAFRAVYEQDAALRRKAAEILYGGVVWFAVVVEAPLDALSKGAGVRGVRLVDIPEEPDATSISHSFRGILPEES